MPTTGMNVKGTALLARRALLAQEFGDEKAAAIFAELVQLVPYFQDPVLASTAIPIEHFFRLQDELLRRYYKNDPLQYFHYGEASAEWALVKGPYKRLLQDKSVARFAEHGVVLYKTYFDEGAAETSLDGGVHSITASLGVSPAAPPSVPGVRDDRIFQARARAARSHRGRRTSGSRVSPPVRLRCTTRLPISIRPRTWAR